MIMQFSWINQEELSISVFISSHQLAIPRQVKIGQFALLRPVETLATLFAMDTKDTQGDSPRKTYQVAANVIDGLVPT